MHRRDLHHFIAGRNATAAPGQRERTPARRRDATAPVLLPAFVAGTVVMVLAIVAMARIDNDWADVGAVVVLAAVAGGLLLAIARMVGDEDTDHDDGGS